MLQILQFVADVAEFFIKKGGYQMLQSLYKMSRMMHNLHISVSVQLQVFRVLLMTQGLRQKKEEKLQILLSFQNVAGTISA